MSFLSDAFAPILAGFYALIPSYGLAIILLTITTRILLLPLSIKQTRSMREMQVIQPEIKRLQKKHKGDRQKLNEEMMKLYKEHGVNPLGGCLPLLLQLPVLFGLFYVIRDPLNHLSSDAQLAQDLTEKALSVHRFLGIRLDCSPVEAWGNSATNAVDVVCGSGTRLVAVLPYVLLILVMGFTTYYQQRQMQANRGNDPQAAQMQMIGRIMPAFLMFISFNFPAGLVVYWLTTNVWTIGQQRIMLKAAPPVTETAHTAKKNAAQGTEKDAAPKQAAAKATAKGAKPKTSGPSKSGSQAAARPKASKPDTSNRKKKR